MDMFAFLESVIYRISTLFFSHHDCDTRGMQQGRHVCMSKNQLVILQTLGHEHFGSQPISKQNMVMSEDALHI